jgi:L-rhamnose mutarotase
MTALPAPSNLPRWFLPALAALGLGSWLLLSLWNDFPYFYHTDEPGKVRQIAENTRNLHHPLLLLESTATAVRARGLSSPQDIVETGRSLSAAFAATAAILLAWTVAQHRGPWTGLAAGLLLILQPDVHEYSRYLKEDAALLFGVCAVFAAATQLEKLPSPRSAAWLGLATTLAISAKYAGAIMLIPAILCFPYQHKNRRLLAFAALATLVTCLALVNYRILTDPATFRSSLSRETSMVLEGHAGVTKSIPHAGFFSRLLNRSAHLLPLCLAGTAAAWHTTRRHHRAEWFLACSPLALAAILAFSAKDSGRYFLPACAGIAATAALGLHQIASSRFARFTIPATAAAALLSLARSWPYLHGFQSDARRELLAWTTASLPPGSRLNQGRKVCLPDAAGRFADGYHLKTPVPFPIETVSYLPDAAPSPAALAARGFTHLAIAGDEFERYLRSDQRPKEGHAAEFETRRRFYAALDSEATLVWSRPPGKVGTHQPELRLYQLDSPPPQPAAP